MSPDQCPHCNHDYPFPEANYCPHCGQPIDSRTSSMNEDIYEDSTRDLPPSDDPRNFMDKQMAITERKQADQQLNTQKRLLQMALDAANIGVWTWDPRSGEETWDQNLYKLLGIDPSLSPNYEVFLETVHPADRDRFQHPSEVNLSDIAPHSHKYRIQREGETRWLRSWKQTIPSPEHGEPMELGITMDITEEHETRQKLQNRDRRLNLALETGGAGIWSLNPETGEEIWGPYYRELLGVDSDTEPSFENFIETVHPEDQEKVRNQVETSLEQCEPYHMEYRIRRNHKTRWLEARAQVIPGEDSDGFRLFGISFDITERKETEQALKQHERQLQMALDAAQAGIWTWNLDTNEEEWDDNLYRMYGLDESVSPSLDTFLEVVHPDDRERVWEEHLQAGQENSSFSDEYRIKRDGETRWIKAWGQVPPISDESSLRVIGISVDITGQKRLQQELEDALQERSTLLQEVHHRVKNNLQMISSLIGVQIRELDSDDPEVLEAFQNLKNRIYSMALVHQQVYEEATIADIDVQDYLEELANHVIKSQSPSTLDVELSTEIEPVPLDVDTLIPCGIVTNELITNALQHGFSDRNEGQISIEFHPGEEDETYELIVSDNGVGFPEKTSFENSNSLGLTLIKRLVRQQLNGSVKLPETENGVTVEMVLRSKDI